MKGGAARQYGSVAEGIAALSEASAELNVEGVDTTELDARIEEGSSILSSLLDHVHGLARPQTHPDLLRIAKDLVSWNEHSKLAISAAYSSRALPTREVRESKESFVEFRNLKTEPQRRYGRRVENWLVDFFGKAVDREDEGAAWNIDRGDESITVDLDPWTNGVDLAVVIVVWLADLALSPHVLVKALEANLGQLDGYWFAYEGMLGFRSRQLVSGTRLNRLDELEESTSLVVRLETALEEVASLRNDL